MNSKFKNLKELLHAVILAFNTGKLALADKKLDFADLGLLMNLIPAIQPAIQDIELIPSEFEKVDGADGIELANFVMAELQVGDEQARKIITESLKTVIQVAALIQAIRVSPQQAKQAADAAAKA